MDTQYYSAEDLTKIFGLSKNSVYKYLKNKRIPSIFDGYRYLTNNEKLFDMLEKDNKMLYLLQETKDKKAVRVFTQYKTERKYERIYYINDIAALCHMSDSWGRSIKERKKISGNYITETEFVDYLKKHIEHAYTIKCRACSNSRYETLRVHILTRLAKEWYKWNF